MSKPSPYKIADLFAGIGGIRKGFELAFGIDNIDVRIVSEIDEYAQITYSANYPGTEFIPDVAMIKTKQMKNLDICLAGFPCQAFSMAGKRMGFDDYCKGTYRGLLFFEIIKILKPMKMEERPKVIFCENVKGLMSHDGGNTLSTILGELEKLNYQVRKEVLNSRYFGVPQNRERVYIVAFREDINCDDFEFPKSFGTQKTLEDIILPEKVHCKYYLSQQYLDTLKKHKIREKAKNHGFGMVIRDYSDVAGALMCGGMGNERNLIVDKKRQNLDDQKVMRGPANSEYVRKLTPREWALLQGFPPDYKLPVTDTHLYKQLGNTVTVPVIEAIALQIKDVIEKHQSN